MVVFCTIVVKKPGSNYRIWNQVRNFGTGSGNPIPTTRHTTRCTSPYLWSGGVSWHLARGNLPEVSAEAQEAVAHQRRVHNGALYKFSSLLITFKSTITGVSLTVSHATFAFEFNGCNICTELFSLNKRKQTFD